MPLLTFASHMGDAASVDNNDATATEKKGNISDTCKWLQGHHEPGVPPGTLDKSITLAVECSVTAKRRHGKHLAFLTVSDTWNEGEARAKKASDKEARQDSTSVSNADRSEHVPTLQVIVHSSRLEELDAEMTVPELASCIHPGCRVVITAWPGTSSTGTSSLYLKSIDIVRVAPVPGAIIQVFEWLESGRLMLKQAAILTADASTDHTETITLQALFARRDEDHNLIVFKHMCDAIALRVSGRRVVVKPHKPKDRVKELLVSLEPVRQAWPVGPVLPLGVQVLDSSSSGVQGKDIVEQVKDLNLVSNLPENAVDDSSRRQYVQERKTPQVQWMIEQMARLCGRARKEEDDGRADISDIIDVGGGRGDLAIWAAVAFPDKHIHVIDLNASSLQQGKVWAQQLGLNNITFTHGDIAVSPVLTSRTRHGNGNVLLVGLHTCGGLTDHIMELSAQHSLPFIVCPCCFPKHPHLRTWSLGDMGEKDRTALLHLAETIEAAEWFPLAMHTVNALRLSAWSSRLSTCSTTTTTTTTRNEGNAGIMTYDRKYSPRNQVLWGLPYSTV